MISKKNLSLSCNSYFDFDNIFIACNYENKKNYECMYDINIDKLYYVLNNTQIYFNLNKQIPITEGHLNCLPEHIYDNKKFKWFIFNTNKQKYINDKFITKCSIFLNYLTLHYELCDIDESMIIKFYKNNKKLKVYLKDTNKTIDNFKLLRCFITYHNKNYKLKYSFFYCYAIRNFNYYVIPLGDYVYDLFNIKYNK